MKTDTDKPILCCPFAGGPTEELWKRSVWDRAKEVDPGSEELWTSLCLGWAIGVGLSLPKAHDFVRHICYHAQML